MRASRATLATTALLCVILCGAALRAQPPADERLRKAADAAQIGDYGQAQALYSSLLSGSATGEKRHQALVASADLRVRTAKPGDTAAVTEAEAAYREAAQAESRPVRWRAQNNLGSLLLKNGRTAEAIAVLEDAVADVTGTAGSPKETRARLLYNAGRALEAGGRPKDALARFVESAVADVAFDRAPDAAVRLAGQLPATDVSLPKLGDMIDALIEGTNLSGAERVVRQLLTLDALKATARYERILAGVMNLLAAQQVDRARFEKSWQQDLDKAKSGMYESGLRILKLVSDAYVGDWELTFDSRALPEERRLPSSNKSTTAAYSRLLKAVADTESGKDEYQRALKRYSLAFAVDRTNAEAAVFTANLLQSSKASALGAQGATGALDKFVDVVFDAKGEAYLGHDDESILRFHTVLGSIYESRGEWGNGGSPRGALFQWQRALQTKQRLESQHPETIRRLPGIRAGLGRALEETGSKDRAWAEYVKAADEFADAGQGERGREVIGRAEKIGYKPSSAEAELAAKVWRKLPPVRGPSSRETSSDLEKKLEKAIEEGKTLERERDEAKQDKEKIRTERDRWQDEAKREKDKRLTLELELEKAKPKREPDRPPQGNDRDTIRKDLLEVGGALVPSLQKLLGERSRKEDRIAAAKLLGAIGPAAAAAVPDLREAAASRDKDVREAAEEALNKVSARTPR
jgi:hypothetical protein